MVDETDEDDAFAGEDEDTQEGMYITFRIGEEDYGIEIRYVNEIICMQSVTDVPDMPEFVKGVINLRGQVIPIMDVRARFHMDEREYDERTCIIVVQYKTIAVGLIVDTVREVTDIPEERIAPPPKTSKGKSAQFIKGMGRLEDSVKILLDVEKLLFEGNEIKLEALAEA